MRNKCIFAFILLAEFVVACGNTSDNSQDELKNKVTSEGGASASASRTAPISGGNTAGYALSSVIHQGGAPISTSSGSEGGASNSSSSSAAKAGDCKPWPREKLLPLVGPFFYGDARGPCRATTVSKPPDGKSLEETFTYDSTGKLIASALDGSVTTYSYEEGLLVKVTTTAPSRRNVATYSYEGLTVNYSAIDETGKRNSYYYELDSLGYPLSTTFVESSSSDSRARVTYEYEDCRLVRRLSFDDKDQLLANDSLVYRYDSKARLLERSSDSQTTTYDYSCW